MKPNPVIAAMLFLALTQAGCGTQIGLSGQAREDYLKSIKPYIAYWTKKGMTEDGRRADSWACGAGPTVLGANNVAFSQEQAQAEKRPEERDDIAARARLRNEWEKCMKTKGYVLVGRKQP